MARSQGKFAGFARRAGAFSALGLARGVALFVGAYSLLNFAASLRSAQPSQNLWWIDPSFMGATLGSAVVAVAAIVLLAFGILPRLSLWRRVATVVACAALAGIALQNVAEFYHAWGAGTFTPGVSVPLSLMIAVMFALLGWAVVALAPGKPGIAGHFAAFVAFALIVALFPLAQIGFFGTSDYRAKADAAVVFGALVYDNGVPSPSLRDRIVEAVGLYRAGLVNTLVMSGGVEPNGYDETAVMRDAAVKAGVPSSAIVRDPKGVNTDATVSNTLAIFASRGIKRVLAVSQGYHLPRVKLAYLSEGFDVRTVPAREAEPIWKTPLFMAREVPAFWQYWLRALARDVRGG